MHRGYRKGKDGVVQGGEGLVVWYFQMTEQNNDACRGKSREFDQSKNTQASAFAEACGSEADETRTRNLRIDSPGL